MNNFEVNERIKRFKELDEKGMRAQHAARVLLNPLLERIESKTEPRPQINEIVELVTPLDDKFLTARLSSISYLPYIKRLQSGDDDEFWIDLSGKKFTNNAETIRSNFSIYYGGEELVPADICMRGIVRSAKIFRSSLVSRTYKIYPLSNADLAVLEELSAARQIIRPDQRGEPNVIPAGRRS